MPDALSTAQKKTPSPAQAASLRNLLKEIVGTETAQVQAETVAAEKEDSSQSWWNTYKGMKASWVLDSEKLPPAVRDDMKEANEYLKKAREKIGREPRADETVEEYAPRKVLEQTHAPSAQSAAAVPETAPIVNMKASVGSMGTGAIRMDDKETPEPAAPQHKLPEATLRRWDELLTGGAEKTKTSTSEAETALGGPLLPPLKKPTATGSRPLSVPRKPPTETVEYMREAATPTTGRVVENGQTVGMQEKNNTKQDVPRQYPAPLLADIIGKGAGLPREKWDMIKDRLAQDALKEDAALKRYVAELAQKRPDGAEPTGVETTAAYIERLLPKPGA